MRLTVRLLGADLLDIELAPTRPAPAPVARPCRYTAAPVEAPDRPALEASGGGDFGFGPLPVVDDRPMPV